MTTDTRSEVRLDVTIEREPVPPSPSQIRGGLRVTVDGRRLMAYRDEDEIEWHEWEPEYIGDLVVLDLGQLFDALLAIRSGETDIYEIEEVRFDGTGRYLALERLSGDHVRIAFRVYPDRDGSTDLAARPASERGYLVALTDLCRDAARCGEDLLTAAREFRHDSPDLPLSSFEVQIERLRGSD